MPPYVTVALAAALGVAALWGMRAGWQHRGARTATAVPALPPVPAVDDPALGTPSTGALEATYVSSTVAGDWLERVVARDLGVRSRATVQVFASGIRIERQGAADVFIPTGTLRDVRTAPGMAGKYVGGEGLVVLTWEAGAALDTGLRLRRAEDRTALLEAARALVRPAAATDTTSTTSTAGTTAGTEETA